MRRLDSHRGLPRSVLRSTRYKANTTNYAVVLLLPFAAAPIASHSHAAVRTSVLLILLLSFVSVSLSCTLYSKGKGLELYSIVIIGLLFDKRPPNVVVIRDTGWLY